MSHALRKKELKELKSKVCLRMKSLCDYLSEFEEGFLITKDKFKLFIVNDIPSFTELKEGVLIPTLVLLKMAGIKALNYVVVDEGAVKHILNGADVMAPGITEATAFNVDDLVAVWNPAKNAPLCVGKALMSSEDIMKVRRGKAIKNLHYAGDDIWKTCLEFISKSKHK